MSILIAMVVGVIVGAVAGKLLPNSADLFILNIFIGIAGGILGMGAYFLLFAGEAIEALFSGRALLCSVVGALILVLTFDGLHLLIVKKGPDPI